MGKDILTYLKIFTTFQRLKQAFRKDMERFENFPKIKIYPYNEIYTGNGVRFIYKVRGAIIRGYLAEKIYFDEIEVNSLKEIL